MRGHRLGCYFDRSGIIDSLANSHLCEVEVSKMVKGCWSGWVVEREIASLEFGGGRIKSTEVH